MKRKGGWIRGAAILGAVFLFGGFLTGCGLPEDDTETGGLTGETNPSAKSYPVSS